MTFHSGLVALIELQTRFSPLRLRNVQPSGVLRVSAPSKPALPSRLAGSSFGGVGETTTSNAVPGMSFSWFNWSSFQQLAKSISPEIYQFEPLSARIMPYFFNVWA